MLNLGSLTCFAIMVSIVLRLLWGEPPTDSDRTFFSVLMVLVYILQVTLAYYEDLEKQTKELERRLKLNHKCGIFFN